MARTLRTLLFSTLYPSSVRPTHGIFVETRLRHLLASGIVQTKVVAPVPWFPSTHRRFGTYAAMARTPRTEYHNGIEVTHPRYPLLPKVGMTSAPILLAAWALPAVKRLLDDGFDFDLIDAHYYYPDGVAAAIIAQCVKKPVIITARGSDLNLIAQFPLPRRMIHWAAARAAASISVSAALQERLLGIGVDSTRLHVIRNGVDLRRFTPMDRSQTRHELGLADGLMFLSVGNLVELKGHDLVIRSLCHFPEAQLAIIGTGHQLGRLTRLAAECGVAGRTRFVGGVPQAELQKYYSAADVLILASSREGWPNVLLEAMACGTPILATRVGGTPEIVKSADAGLLCDERSERGITQTLHLLLQNYPDRAATRRYAEQFGWDETTNEQLSLFRAVVERHGQSSQLLPRCCN